MKGFRLWIAYCVGVAALIGVAIYVDSLHRFGPYAYLGDTTGVTLPGPWPGTLVLVEGDLYACPRRFRRGKLALEQQGAGECHRWDLGGS